MGSIGKLSGLIEVNLGIFESLLQSAKIEKTTNIIGLTKILWYLAGPFQLTNPASTRASIAVSLFLASLGNVILNEAHSAFG